MGGKKKKGKKGKKGKKVARDPDEFDTMDGSTLEVNIQKLRERLQDAKVKRNII
jgi:hypothetical protein